LQIIDYYNINSVNIFAKEYLGYASSEKINRLRKEGTSPSYEILNDITKKFEKISPDWLLTGSGSMLKSNYDQPAPESLMAAESNTQCQLCNIKDQLIRSQQQTIDLLTDKLNHDHCEGDNCCNNEKKAG
jgi:phage repressor protein C with HTH and peptisase S24 domain